MLRTIFLGVLLAVLGSAKAQTIDGNVVQFHAAVRVDVGADGKPTRIDVPEDFPASVREFISKRVASWQYQPATRDGVPQAATTYVEIEACAVPVAGGYRLAADFGGNGMRAQGDRPLPPPLYPMHAQMRGVEAEIVVVVNIDGQGNSSFERFESEEFHGGNTRINAAMRQSFENSLRQWAATLHFDPELVGGQPVPMAQASIPVTFSLWRGMDRERAELQAQAKASSECRMASSGQPALEPIALHPAVTVNPQPVGEG